VIGRLLGSDCRPTDIVPYWSDNRPVPYQCISSYSDFCLTVLVTWCHVYSFVIATSKWRVYCIVSYRKTGSYGAVVNERWRLIWCDDVSMQGGVWQVCQVWVVSSNRVFTISAEVVTPGESLRGWRPGVVDWGGGVFAGYSRGSNVR